MLPSAPGGLRVPARIAKPSSMVVVEVAPAATAALIHSALLRSA
jgi:hypothetical protein